MYSKKDFDRDYKRNTRDVKQTKPVLIGMAIFGAISIVLLIISAIRKDWVMYYFGISFLAICITVSTILIIFYFLAKKDLKNMNAGEETYIKLRQKEEQEELRRKYIKKLRKGRNQRNQRPLEDDIDDYIFYDEVFDD